MKKHSISRWIIACFTGFFILSLALSSVANYMENRSGVSEQVKEEAIRLLDTVRIVLEEEIDFEKVVSSTDREEYSQTEDIMVFLAFVYEVDSLTVYTIDPETRERQVILSVTPEDRTDEDDQAEEPPDAMPDFPLQPVEEQWLDGDEYTYDSFSSGDQVTWIMAGRGLKTGRGYLVALDNSILPQNRQIWNNFMWDIMPIGLVLLQGMIILLILVRRKIIKPIGMISDSMKRFAEDRSHKPEPLYLRSRDEIAEIAASYTKMTEDISAYVNSIETLTKEKLETDVQLEVARRIQYGLVPGETSLKGDGFDAYATTKPAKAVGGDFYDVFQRDKDSVCVMIGDVSGKGISAAIIMAMAKTIIREKLMAGLSPATALNQANSELCGQNPEGLFTTAFAAVFTPRTGELRYANAGHTRPVLLGETPSIFTPDPGIALGLFGDADIRDYSLRLEPAEGILLYTDGLTEAVDMDNRFFGEKRLLETVRSIPRGTDARDALSRVSSAVSMFHQGREAFDDIAGLVLFRVPEENSGREIPVALSSFEIIKKAVFEAAGNTPETRKLLLACDETLANIVSYSGATELSFSCKREGNELRIAFTDNGIPFDPTRVPTEEKAFESLGNGGMGIGLIRQIASGMHYERRQGRNEFEMSFPLPGSPEKG